VTSRISVAFVFVLIFFAFLGHACELPIGQIVAAHAHEDAHDSSDHHADDNQVACDAVLAIQSSTHALSKLDVAVHAGPHPVLHTVALHGVFTPLPDSYTGHQRPPLFLLHAALLI
jgi:hypothetical protein